MNLKGRFFQVLSCFTFGKTKAKYLPLYLQEKLKRKSSESIRKYLDTWCNVINENGRDITVLSPKIMLAKYPDHTIPLLPDCEFAHCIIHIDEALKLNQKIDTIGLVFFMGIGDYFYATRFLELLKNKYSHLKIDAYVSNHLDGNNAPLVKKCLENNPNINEIYEYSGLPNLKNWKKYDYSEVLKNAKENELILPMIYCFKSDVTSRTDTLCKTFSLETPNIIMPPIIYPLKQKSEKVEQLYSKIKESYEKKEAKIIYLQLSSRSQFLTYPKTDELINNLLDRGYIVITADETMVCSDRLFKIDTKQFNINESVELVRLLKVNNYPIYLIGIVSCFMSVSSGLNIPNLTMMPEFDFCVRGVWFPNVFMITTIPYRDELPSSRYFVAKKGDYEKYSDKNGVKKDIFYPEFVLQCFDNMSSVLG